jgi:hypothetical protein
MSAVIYEPLPTQVSPEALSALRRIAEVERRQFQTVLDEALREYIARKEKELLRPPLVFPIVTHLTDSVFAKIQIKNKGDLIALIYLY